MKSEMTQGFSENREDEVGVRLGKIEHLLDALAQADALGTAGAKGNEGLPDLVALPLPVILGIQEPNDAAHAFRHRHGQCDHADDRSEEHTSELQSQ